MLECIANELYGDPSRAWPLRAQNANVITDPDLKKLLPGQVLLAPPRTFGSRFPMRRIPVPDWAPDYARGEVKLDGVSHHEYEWLQQRRLEIICWTRKWSVSLATI
jgi:hypothetical protein